MAGEVLVSEKTRQACLNWLRYSSLEKRRYKRDQVSPGIAYLGVVASGGSAEKIGSFRPALREAQFYWAAATLNDPMFRATAFAVRNMRNRTDVTYYLYLNHRVAWLAWKASHAVYAFRGLISSIAEEMAMALEAGLY